MDSFDKAVFFIFLLVGALGVGFLGFVVWMVYELVMWVTSK